MTASPETRPNIILILVDDMGFSDIGCYGSEVRTPNLELLSATGLWFTQMYNSARCCPSRAALLTGLNPHQAGIGHMTRDLGAPSYQGYLNRSCATIAEVLRDRGYRDPARVAAMARQYVEWAERCGVLPWPVSPDQRLPDLQGEHTHSVQMRSR